MTTKTWQKQPRMDGQLTSLEGVPSEVMSDGKIQPQIEKPTSSEGAPSGTLPTWKNQPQSGQPTKSEGVLNNEISPRTIQRSKMQALPHVSLLAKVLKGDIMAQRTEIFDLGIHGVELVNKIREDIDPRIIISSPMGEDFILALETLLAQQEYVHTNVSEHYLRTNISYRSLRAIWSDQYTHLIRILAQNRGVVLIAQRQCRLVDLIGLNSENADDYQYQNRQQIIDNYHRAVSGGYNSSRTRINLINIILMMNTNKRKR